MRNPKRRRKTYSIIGTTLQERIKRENEDVNKLIAQSKKRKIPISIFRARPNKGIGADRSVYLYRWHNEAHWIQGRKFWEDNHQERCDLAISKIKQVSDLFLYPQGTNYIVAGEGDVLDQLNLKG